METTTPHITSTESSHTVDGSSTQIVRQVPKPVDAADRIQTVDMVRGFALLGILMMNIPLFGINNNHAQTIINGPHTTADYWTFATVSSLFEGSMRGLFSMLFGAGMILFTMNKKDSPGGITVTEYYYRRLLLLDRKSTRLNSSHSQISYAVFCLKKKKLNYIIYVFQVK